MTFVIGVLTFILVLDCLLLVLLVLIQLPKKDAGAGVAFGGAATDALFGAGSGNVLTKTTKYAAIVFFALAMVLSLLQSRFYHRARTELREQIAQPGGPTAPLMPRATPAKEPAATAPIESAPPAATTNAGVNLLLSTPGATTTNAPTPAPPQK
jgi:preprotein translocase subunit SecG